MSNRILVVDDCPYVADAFARLISVCGYETSTAYDGSQAIEQIAAFNPSVVMMDICMPVMDGYETARRIRRELGHSNIVLIAVTCLAQQCDIELALASGFNLHVAKPVGLSTLYSVLAQSNRKLR
jgi:CheY-like chemotaxis protein